MLCLAGCGGSDSERDPGAASAPITGPTALQPAAASSAPGTRRVICDLRADSGRVRLAINLPTKARSAPTSSPRQSVDCAWRVRMRMPREDGLPPTYGELRIAVDHVGRDEQWPTLADRYESQQRFAVEGDIAEGDDSILHLDLEERVSTFGATVGDRLSFQCYCDGQNITSRFVQADGVLLSWSSVKELESETDAHLAVALRGAGTVG